MSFYSFQFFIFYKKYIILNFLTMRWTQLKNKLGLFITSDATYVTIVGHHSEKATNNKLAEVLNRCHELQTYSDELWEKSVINENLLYQYGIKKEIAQKALDDASQNFNTLTERIEALQKQQSESAWDKVSQSVGDTKADLDKVKEYFDKILNTPSGSDNSSSFWGIDDINQIMSNYQAFLDNLTLDQKYAVIHILLSIIIFLSLFNIIGLYLGDELIKFLKLEEKYPKIAKYIRLRRRFITYNIIFDSLIILLALIVIVGFNLYNILY